MQTAAAPRGRRGGSLAAVASLCRELALTSWRSSRACRSDQARLVDRRGAVDGHPAVGIERDGKDVPRLPAVLHDLEARTARDQENNAPVAVLRAGLDHLVPARVAQ